VLRLNPGWPRGKAEDFGSSTEGSNPSPGTSLFAVAVTVP
jgi:hypothetical protein